ncbi:MAG: oxidoreductase [Candidatus Hodarchaeales archaeon]|jgi:NAD(P)-dependent dehydrogenase (short-subunit alcohol dehydrogenase family)
MSTIWTTDKIPDLTGKRIIVTGANSGIGFEAAKEFARKGAETILACRNVDKAEKASDRIKKRNPDAKTVIMQLDLSSLKSIMKFVEGFKKNYFSLDVLLNNAGIMFVPYRTTNEGFESQVGINHLGHFALTGLLFNLLARTPGARVVNVSSNGHKMGKIDFDNYIYKNGKGYSRLGAYGRSKLSNLLFTYELNRRFKTANIDAIAVAAHPGLSNTNLIRQWYVKVLKPIMFLTTQSAHMGALPLIRAATDPDVKGSEYYGPRGRGEQRGHPIRVESNGASHNKEDAINLWHLSEKLTGVSFPI